MSNSFEWSILYMVITAQDLHLPARLHKRPTSLQDTADPSAGEFIATRHTEDNRIHPRRSVEEDLHGDWGLASPGVGARRRRRYRSLCTASVRRPVLFIPASFLNRALLYTHLVQSYPRFALA